MTQTLALLLDAYRELNAKKMFWITMILSGLIVAIFGCIGINEQGLKLLVWQLDTPTISTQTMTPATFYKSWFVNLGIAFWLAWVATILAIISTGGIFPDLMTSGSIDTLLSKPISRLRLFMTKYALGLMFVALQVLVFCVASFLVIGIRGGVWEPGLFIAVPMVVLFFSYLFSVCVLLGVWTRSTMVAILVTILLWFGLFLVNQADGTMLVLRAGAEVQAEGAQERLDLAREMPPAEIDAKIEEIIQKSWMGADDPLVEPLRAARDGDFGPMEADVDRAERSAAMWTKWSRLAFTVKTIFPKTGETIGLLERWLISLADLPSAEPEESDPMMANTGFGGDPAMQTRVMELSRERPVWWILGTSILFEIVMLSLAAWKFCRRDY